MITVVTLNPSIDRTLSLPTFAAGRTNRANTARVDAGGKGVNVCRHLLALGAEDVCCVGFMRSAEQAMFDQALQGVHCQWLTLPGHVRTNTKICASNGELTEINEAGESIPPEMIDPLLALCRRTFAKSDAVVLTGSISPGVPANIYARLIDIARKTNTPCLLDADGDALRMAIPAKPHFVKPNRAELERLMERALPDEAALADAAEDMMAQGIPYGCISLGDQGAMFFSNAWILHLPAMDVPVRSTVGAGDAMAAAFAFGMAQKKMGEKELFRLAVAASAAAVSTEGTQPVDAEMVQALLKSQLRIRIREI